MDATENGATNGEVSCSHESSASKRQRTSSPAPAVDGEEEAKAAFEARMALYNQYKANLKAERSAKPDMVACKQLYTERRMPPMVYGPVPGVPPGSVFTEKGELEVARLHSGIMRGISWPTDFDVGRKGAYSIVMSGAYKDDRDEGDEFDYTGMGLGKNDQEYKSGNLALKNSMTAGTPVRVIRRLETKANGRLVKKYVFEGLYDVTSTWKEASSDGTGRQVIMFHFKKQKDNTKEVAGSVAFRPKAHQALLWSSLTQRVSLVGARSRAVVSKETLEEKEERRLEAMNVRPGLLCEDISNGMERVRIPVFNELDMEPMPNHRYVVKTELSEGVSPMVLEAALNPSRFDLPLGISQPTHAKEAYCGRPLILRETHPGGILECDAPPIYKLVSRGVRLPLEVFKTRDHGWGVRCWEVIPGGTFVCEYGGQLLTDAEADALGKDNHHYFFALDHFSLMSKMFAAGDVEGGAVQLPEPVRRAALETSVIKSDPPVIDAQHVGNVGRFLNHSDKGNLHVQPVFTDAEHSLIFYRVAFFANCDIEAGTELTYDYGYQYGDEAVMPEWAKARKQEEVLMPVECL